MKTNFQATPTFSAAISRLRSGAAMVLVTLLTIPVGTLVPSTTRADTANPSPANKVHAKKSKTLHGKTEKKATGTKSKKENSKAKQKKLSSKKSASKSIARVLPKKEHPAQTHTSASIQPFVLTPHGVGATSSQSLLDAANARPSRDTSPMSMSSLGESSPHLKSVAEDSSASLQSVATLESESKLEWNQPYKRTKVPEEPKVRQVIVGSSLVHGKPRRVKINFMDSKRTRVVSEELPQPGQTPILHESNLSSEAPEVAAVEESAKN